MRLVFIVRRLCDGRWEYEGKASIPQYWSGYSCGIGFQNHTYECAVVTLESAREDYGVTVPPWAVR